MSTEHTQQHNNSLDEIIARRYAEVEEIRQLGVTQSSVNILMRILRLKDVFALKSVLTLNVLWILEAIVDFVTVRVFLAAVSAHAPILVRAKVRRRPLLTRRRLKRGNRWQQL